MKRIAVRISVSCLVLMAIFLAVQISLNQPIHCGRCGIQKWEFYILWFDLADPCLDEYGTVGRWKCAHRSECDHIWLDGPLGREDSEYWPALHLHVAKGGDLAKIEYSLRDLNASSVSATDALGRTLLHWLVMHPDVEGRDRLVGLLVEHGLSMESLDIDGLSPIDWRRNCDDGWQHSQASLPRTTRTAAYASDLPPP